jgi:3-oxoadipate enol-lactonase
MAYLSIHGSKFFYKLEGSGPPVVLIHGLGADHRLFDGPVKDCLLEDHQVLAMDLRGHGKSTRAGKFYSTELFARDVEAMMEALGIRSAVVIGISMGGAVAMKLAARESRRVSRLVLIDTWARCDEAARACFDEWIAASGHDEQVLRRIVLIRTATVQFVDANPDFVALFNQTWPSVSGRAFVKSCLACAEHDATGELGKIRAETLVMTGSRDILVPPIHGRQVTSGIGQASFRVIKGGGHVPWLDEPDAFVRTLRRFLSKRS